MGRKLGAYIAPHAREKPAGNVRRQGQRGVELSGGGPLSVAALPRWLPFWSGQSHNFRAGVREQKPQAAVNVQPAPEGGAGRDEGGRKSQKRHRVV